MKRCYFAVLAALALGLPPPAAAQFLYVDADGDGACTPSDVLQNTTASVDVYLETNRNVEGEASYCGTDEDIPMSVSSYSFILRKYDPYGEITFGAWSDNLGYPTGATDSGARMEDGTDLWIALGGGPVLPPGKHKLGTLAMTVTGSTSYLVFATSSPLSPRANSSFGSACPGADSDNTIKFGVDFPDVCGTVWAVSSVTQTTWGKIKAAYR